MGLNRNPRGIIGRKELLIVEEILKKNSRISDSLPIEELAYLLLFHLAKEPMKGFSDISNIQLECLYIYYSSEVIQNCKNLINSLNDLDLNHIKNVFGIFFKKGQSLSQKELLRLLPLNLRKNFAVYYTKNEAAYLMSKLSWRQGMYSALDPSSGEGVLLSNLRQIDDNIKLYGIDLFLPSHSNKNQDFVLYNTDFLSRNDLLKDKKLIPKNHDLIIMNPPYTRWSKISKEYQHMLLNKFNSTSSQRNMQMGLQGYFILHSNNFLKKGGIMAAVLPASTFTSNYGVKIRDFILENYSILYMISSDKEDAFSENSTFTEVIMIAQKQVSLQKSKFITLLSKLNNNNKEKILENILSGNKKNDLIHINEVEVAKLKESNNWMQHFHSISFLFLNNLLNKSSHISTMKENIISVKRGLETFGPQFFLIPNSVWSITKETNNEIMIHNKINGTDLSFPRLFLVNGLTNPKKYIHSVTPSTDYLVSIPSKPLEELPIPVQDYIKWGSKQNIAILKNPFAKKHPWYTFINHQLKSEKSVGNVFLVRKMRLNTQGVIAHFIDESCTASKGYYIIKCNPKYAKALVAWLNCSVSLLQIIYQRRKIANHWGEIMLRDLRKLKCINLQSLQDKELHNISNALDIFSKNELPGINKQLDTNYRRNLDNVIMSILGISNFYDDLISSIKHLK